MGKINKRTVKFLRTAAKAVSKGGVRSGEGTFKKGGRKKPRQDKDNILDDMVVEKVISMKGGKSLSNKEKEAQPKGSVKRHKDELQSLQDKDPEFFQYLQDNDANLLTFGEGDEDEDLDGELELEDEDDDEDEDEMDMSEDDAGETEDQASVTGEIPKFDKGGRHEAVEVTEEILNNVISKALSGSLVGLKRLLSIFRAACQPAAQEMDDDEDVVDQSTAAYTIPSPEIYQLVMVGVTDNAHVALYKQLDLTELSPDCLSKMDKHPRWKKVQFMILSYFKSMLHTLSSVAVASKQEEVAVFLVTSLESYLPLLSPMPRLCKAVLNALLRLWSQGQPPGEDGVDVRVHAFMKVRQMSLMLPGAVREECFRSIYLSYARGCKTFTETGGSGVLFMAQCVAELYVSDPVQAYQQAFIYIRQLALHLRTALVKKTSDAVRQVTNWQFLNCLRLWTRVICTMPEPDALGPLIFPLAQIMFGVMASAPSVYFVPLRLHLITCLHQLAASGKVFIPTAARLAEILEHPDLTVKPTPSTDLAPKIQFLVRLPADSILKVAVRDLVVAEVVTLIRHDAEIYRFHVGLPEYSYLTIRKLRAFGKKTKINKWRDLCRALAGQLEEHSTFAKRSRVKLGKSPMQIMDFEPLLTADVPLASVRLQKLLSSRVSTAQREVIVGHEYGARAAVGDKKATSSAAAEDDDDDEEEGGDEDDEEGDDDDDADEMDDDSEVVDTGNMEDKLGNLDWSDDEQ